MSVKRLIPNVSLTIGEEEPRAEHNGHQSDNNACDPSFVAELHSGNPQDGSCPVQQIKDVYLGLKESSLPLTACQAKISLSRMAPAITADAPLISRTRPDISFSAT